ncbi:4'-phosphopantetheinyl transferase family protein [Planktosalinus lacus]|uniref:4'-phosphopantetheinyl transferase n=1 Tax=Planktosalinus lacus TaxID=1526573 RepID=A0A8J2VAS9_9FLAO|nr:4'-phosphopantetheinyl transferase family protein [Planktosalinus lacus]GGD96108.1 4'-phosphopantetheinyl transferase [Planktosalinus lacus]
MPLYKTITINPHTKVLIWKIEEPFEELIKDIPLTENSRFRISKMLSDIHKRGFLSVRHLLKEAGYTDFDLVYNEDGKPDLKDHTCISITHSHEFSGIIISKNEVGIDIEKQRDKILRIANKFTPLKEYRTLANDAAVIQKLTIVWCAKEALYKLYANRGVSFLHHIDVRDFQFEDNETTAEIIFNGKINSYQVHFFEFEQFTCAYALC